MDSLSKSGEFLFFFLFLVRNIANVLEVLFQNSFLEVELGFFSLQLAKFSQKKKNAAV
jgi:hypothetical protein